MTRKHEPINASAFSELDLGAYPPFADIATDLDRVLWVLLVAERGLAEDSLTPHEIAVVLRDAVRHDLSRQRIDALLTANRGLVAPRRRDGRRCYQLMQQGVERVEASRRAVVFIEPAKGHTRTREVQELLSATSGRVRICDPYWAPRSLDFLTGLIGASAIQVLTDKIDKIETVRRELKALAKELAAPVEIRRAPTRVLHDRYVIDDKTMLILGTSLNGIGLKQSMVVAVGEDLRSVACSAFDALWAKSSPL